MKFNKVKIISNETIIQHAKYVEKLMNENPHLTLDEAWMIVPRVFITKEELMKRFG